MNEKILKRIIAETKNADVFDALIEKISLADLQSLLLSVYQKRIKELDVKHLFSQYTSNRFVQPSKIDAKKFAEFDKLAFSLLPKNYEILELSPVSPLGSCSLLGPVHQNNVLTTIRNTEVNSDATNILAMECSKRRKKHLETNETKFEKVKLCSSHRVLRTQSFEGDDSAAHFKLLSLCSAGKDAGFYTFEMEELVEQIEYFVTLLTRISEIGLNIFSPRVSLIVYDNKFLDSASRLITSLIERNDDLKIDIEQFTGTQKYYDILRYQIYATNAAGEEYFICDGGFTNWTQTLLNNRKERFLSSGFGVERLFLVFENR